jgi:hypothetical protein
MHFPANKKYSANLEKEASDLKAQMANMRIEVLSVAAEMASEMAQVKATKEDEKSGE